MLDELKKLNERIYELYGRLYENEELLTKKQTDYIADKLFEAYKQEYGVLALNAEPDTAGEAFAARERRRLLVPYVPKWLARIFLRKRTNAAAKLILREVREAAERAFAERTAKLDAATAEEEEAEQDAAEQAEEQPAALQAVAEQAAPETDAAQEAEQEQPPADGQPAPPQAEPNTGTAPEQGTEHAEPNGAQEHGTRADVSLIAESKPSAAQAEGRQEAVGAAG